MKLGKHILTDIEEAEQKVNYVLFSYAADGEKYDVTKSYRTLAISHEVDGENVTRGLFIHSDQGRYGILQPDYTGWNGSIEIGLR